jgi:hypothetical protein
MSGDMFGFLGAGSESMHLVLYGFWENMRGFERREVSMIPVASNFFFSKIQAQSPWIVRI